MLLKYNGQPLSPNQTSLLQNTKEQDELNNSFIQCTSSYERDQTDLLYE